MRFSFAHAVLRCAAVCALLSASASAEETPETAFESDKFKFKISYPAFFVPVEDQQPLVGLFLRDRGGEYPTFNVLAQPGALDTSKFRESELASKVATSYQEVGFTDASVEDARKLEVGGRPAFLAELLFRKSDSPLRARTILVTGEPQHYILTFIDTDAAFTSHRAAFDKMTATFSLPPRPPPREAPPPENDFWLAIQALAILALGAYVLMRRRTGSA